MSDRKDDPRAIEEARERLRRADTSHSPAGQSQSTGTGGGGGAVDPLERGPAETARGAMEGDQGAPPSAGSAGVATGLNPGGTRPKTGAGGHGERAGSVGTPGAAGRPRD
ncbi:hypothetical protein [Azospirillum sp. ST 5-10]|uniref:hypothetical protein n=1 Tax=unclassified Azospirillum TaxID=2630922 RepID=UPI003F4A6022